MSARRGAVLFATLWLVGTSWVQVGAEESAAVQPERKANRLAKEKSPYLLQHAYNPVDWYPWGEEAFERASREQRPIFLSIGYSTCHWCHVMERESFADPEIAAYLNENFVSIKVDREERPDVDRVYIAAVQVMTGRAGWPLSLFLTPQKQVFFGGTYFPPRDGKRPGMLGFLTIIQRVVDIWKKDPATLREHGEKLQKILEEQAQGVEAGTLGESSVLAAFSALRATSDPVHGGFGKAPKFPRTSNLDFLMRYAHTRPEDREAAMAMVYRTLDAMLRGGIRDHLAGGFHRYSVDQQWLIPHFEKMLYDQALITRALVDAYRISGKESYREAARETMDYVLTRMTHSEGGIYCAEDADTDHVEGKTYIWSLDEVLAALGETQGPLFAEYYGVSKLGNFEDHGHRGSVLNHISFPGGIEEYAKKKEQDPEVLRREFAKGRATLLERRDARPQPLKDDKILTAWNGLAISALTGVYQITNETKYLDAARRAAEFVLRHLSRDGALARRYRSGETIGMGFLEDYAFFDQGLLDLYETTFDPRWLKEAVRLGHATIDLFWDKKRAGFFSSSDKHEALIVRSKEFYDGAIPSGNSVAFLNLLRLEELTGDKIFAERAVEMAALAGGLVEKSVQAHPQLLCGAIFRLQGAKEIVLVGARSDPLTRAMIDASFKQYLPARVLLHAESDDAARALASTSPLLEQKIAIGGKPTAYVCRKNVCKLPARDIETFRTQLKTPHDEP